MITPHTYTVVLRRVLTTAGLFPTPTVYAPRKVSKQPAGDFQINIVK